MAKCTNKGCSNECDAQLTKDQRCFGCYLKWSKDNESLNTDYKEGAGDFQ